MKSSICLVECGSFRHWRCEEPDEVLVGAEPVVAVVLGPARVGVELIVEAMDRAHDVIGRERDGGPDVGDPLNPLRACRSHDRCPQRPAGDRDERGALSSGRVHHRERVGGKLTGRVRLGARRAIGTAVSATVEREHTEVTCEVRDLQLPAA